MRVVNPRYGEARHLPLFGHNSSSQRIRQIAARTEFDMTPSQVAADVVNSSNMPAYHAGYFVGVSIKEYCPQYMSKVSGT